MDTRINNIENGAQPESQPGRDQLVGASVLRLAESIRRSFGDAEVSTFMEAERLAQLGITDANLNQMSNSANQLAYLPPNTVQPPRPENTIDYGVAAQES